MIILFPTVGPARELNYSEPMTLKDMQNEVGGPIEVAPTPQANVQMIVNEEGRLLGFPRNPHWPHLVGEVLMLTDDDLLK